MYSDCLFCGRPFEPNQELKYSPRGGRIAFDPTKGRLWVVCRHCQQWNLTPIAERWEAVEECETIFRQTPLRVTTGQIGLAGAHRHLELVRIGKPLLSEMAAWRYGDQFGSRRRKQFLLAGLATSAVGLTLIGGVAAGAGVAGLAYLGLYWFFAYQPRDPDRIVRIPTSKKYSERFALRDLRKVRLLTASGKQRWKLEISSTCRLSGNYAVNAAALLVPHVNRFGGTRSCIEKAVRFVEQHRTPHGVFTAAARMKDNLVDLPRPIRLALEMAAHDRIERARIGEELQLLRRNWAEAETVAAISDQLTVPAGVEQALAKLKQATTLRRTR